MNAADLIVLAPWLLFGVGLGAICYRLFRPGHNPPAPPSDLMTSAPGWAWAAAGLAICCLLTHRPAREQTTGSGVSRAVLVSAAWVGAGIAFGLVVALWQGGDVLRPPPPRPPSPPALSARLRSTARSSPRVRSGQRLGRGPLRGPALTRSPSPCFPQPM